MNPNPSGILPLHIGCKRGQRWGVHPSRIVFFKKGSGETEEGCGADHTGEVMTLAGVTQCMVSPEDKQKKVVLGQKFTEQGALEGAEA